MAVNTHPYLLLLCGAVIAAACGKKHKGDDGSSTVPYRSPYSIGASGPVLPTGYQDLDVQTLITQAYSAGKSSVTIPAGTWLVHEIADASAHLSLTGINNFTISAAGATLVFADPKALGIAINSCSNLTINGLTVDYAEPAFSQGTILAVASNGSSMDVEVDSGYPTYLDNPTYFPAQPAVYIYDSRTLQIKVGSSDLYPTGISRIGANTFRYGLPNGSGGAAVGDLFSTRGNFAFTTYVGSSSHITFNDYTVYTGGFAMMEYGGAGNHVYKNFKVTFGPTPAGGNRQRLVSTNADAFHSSDVRGGPQLNSCLFEGMTDDGVNINGAFGKVVGVAGNDITMVAAVNSFVIVAGDLLRFMDSSGNLLGDAHVTKVTGPLNNGQPPVSSGSFSGSVYFTLSLDSTPASVNGSLLWDTNTNGQGFIISNSTIRNNRARGMLIKADNGQILDNTIDGASTHGILVDPEVDYYAEAGFVRSLVVKGNTIEHTGRSSPTTYNAVSLTGLSAQSHSGIQFLSNQFNNNYGIDLLASAAQTVTIENNTFTGKTDAQKALLGAAYSHLPVVKLSNVNGVTLGGNSYPSGQPHTGQASKVSNASGEPLTPVSD